MYSLLQLRHERHPARPCALPLHGTIRALLQEHACCCEISQVNLHRSVIASTIGICLRIRNNCKLDPGRYCLFVQSYKNSCVDLNVMCRVQSERHSTDSVVNTFRGTKGTKTKHRVSVRASPSVAVGL